MSTIETNFNGRTRLIFSDGIKRAFSSQGKGFEGLDAVFVEAHRGSK